MKWIFMDKHVSSYWIRHFLVDTSAISVIEEIPNLNLCREMWARTGILLFQVKQSSPRILIHMWTNQLSLSHGENQISILFTVKFSLLGICCVEPFFTFWNFYYTCHTNDTYHISLSPSFNVIHVKFSAAFWELFSRKKIASSWQHNFTYKIRCLFQWPAVVA